MTIPTLKKTVERMKKEIRADVLSLSLPAQVASFSDLHDYVDANEYGGFCEDELCDSLIAHFGGRDHDEGMPDGMLAYMGAARSLIDLWIKSGGMRGWLRMDPRPLVKAGEWMLKCKALEHLASELLEDLEGYQSERYSYSELTLKARKTLRWGPPAGISEEDLAGFYK